MIYKTKLRGKRFRFLLHEGELFVPKADMDAMMLASAPTRLRRALKDGVNTPEFRKLFATSDFRSVRLGDNIGLGFHAHAIGEMISTAASMVEDEQVSDTVMIFARRMKEMLPRYVIEVTFASHHLGISRDDPLAQFQRRRDRINPAYPVRVEQDVEAGVWLGFNEEIGLFIEADSYEELKSESWLVVPELLELSGIQIREKEDGSHELYHGPLRLDFMESTTAALSQTG